MPPLAPTDSEYGAPSAPLGSVAGATVMTGHETVNGSLSTGPSVPVVALSCLLPSRLTANAANVARPLPFEATGAPPVSAPFPIRLSPTISPPTPLPKASVTRTVTGGVITAPTNTGPGCCSNASAAAAPAVTSNATLTAAVLSLLQICEPKTPDSIAEGLGGV